MPENSKARTERFRERRRRGHILVTVAVRPQHRQALERMGLITSGHGDDKRAVAWAVERYLDTAQAVQQLGDLLYPNVEDFFGAETPPYDEPVSPENRGERDGF